MNAPPVVSAVMREITDDAMMGEGVRAMNERASEFSTPLAARLAGVALVPEALRHLDDALDKMWKDASEKPIGALQAEVVIGSGLHAAIYSAVRVATGHPRPLVLEASPRVGGAFAVSRAPSFYLNSRNRPGNLSIPGKPGALNVLPGAVVQPSDLSGDEYQRNSDLALAIRSTLMMNAKVVVGRKVTEIALDKRGVYVIKTESDRPFRASRVILASGLGEAKRLGPAHESVMTFAEFMTSMDQPFPLRRMHRVAVIGAGDSGRTVIEALTGQGPSTRMSVASLDWLERIDWYGAKETTRVAYEQCNRSRYRGIGRLLPAVAGGEGGRVTAIPSPATSVAGGWGCGYVNECPYDAVIDCTGYKLCTDGILLPGGWAFDPLLVEGRVVGLQGRNDTESQEAYFVGPRANLSISDIERASAPALTQVPENSTSLFRYAGRTAALAGYLRAVKAPPAPRKKAKATKPRVRGRRQPPNDDTVREILASISGDIEYSASLK